MKSKIYCNKCGAEFSLSILERKEGDLDVTYIQCPHCKEEYLVSVTDSILRDAIQEHNRLMEKARTAADEDASTQLAETARRMKENNSRRCFELMAEYIGNKEK